MDFLAADTAGLSEADSYKAQFAAVSVVDTAILSRLLTSRIMVPAEMEEYERELEGSNRRHLAYVADLARENADAGLREVIRGVWDALVARHLYVTGGVGAEPQREVALLHGGCYGDDTGAEQFADLDRRGADAAGCAEHQQDLKEDAQRFHVQRSVPLEW